MTLSSSLFFLYRVELITPGLFPPFLLTIAPRRTRLSLFFFSSPSRDAKFALLLFSLRTSAANDPASPFFVRIVRSECFDWD